MDGARRAVSKLAGARTNSEHRRRRGVSRARGYRRTHACGNSARCRSRFRPRLAAMPGSSIPGPAAPPRTRCAMSASPLAVVGGDHSVRREDAASLISADIEDLPARVDLGGSGRRSPGAYHDGAETDASTSIEVGRRRRGCRLQGCLLCAGQRFTVHRHTAVPLEARGLVAAWDGAETRMTVFGITKVPFFNRSMLASMLDLPEASVVMKVADAGGGFGVRGEFYPEDS